MDMQESKYIDTQLLSGIQTENNFMQLNIFLLRIVLMITVCMICLILKYLLTYIFQYPI